MPLCLSSRVARRPWDANKDFLALMKMEDDDKDGRQRVAGGATQTVARESKICRDELTGYVSSLFGGFAAAFGVEPPHPKR